ncbi:hypothetical protein GN244_ATG18299 [Phytophthora infestans]|uniref:Uncharacterized protein n=1 Tax=Phytophthora infestans TaxID=4787 RepID=A0A833W4W1_PHYIN|nr:hypothetical protein GN244_ATG18299 [Phytophthora infestans]
MNVTNGLTLDIASSRTILDIDHGSGLRSVLLQKTRNRYFSIYGIFSFLRRGFWTDPRAAYCAEYAHRRHNRGKRRMITHSISTTFHIDSNNDRGRSTGQRKSTFQHRVLAAKPYVYLRANSSEIILKATATARIPISRTLGIASSRTILVIDHGSGLRSVLLQKTRNRYFSIYGIFSFLRRGFWTDPRAAYCAEYAHRRHNRGKRRMITHPISTTFHIDSNTDRGRSTGQRKSTFQHRVLAVKPYVYLRANASTKGHIGFP